MFCWGTQRFGGSAIAAMIALARLCMFRKYFRKKFQLKDNLPALFLIVVFFFQWIPYVLISRVVFIYHFYVNVPIVCLASAFWINEYWGSKWGKLLTVVYFAAVVALFVLFYPVISGVPASSQPSTA